jgi:hypothetical protein
VLSHQPSAICHLPSAAICGAEVVREIESFAEIGKNGAVKL